MLSRFFPALLAAGLVMPAVAAAARNPMPAVHADDWSQASEDAQAYADPVAAKLVLYYRLLAPGQATAAQIADFVAENPDWPNQALLERRRQEAIAAGPDGPDVLAQCTAKPLTLPGALARCASVLAAGGDTQAAASDAHEAWTSGLDNPAIEPGFLAQWGASLTPVDNWARFDHFAWTNAAAASRQLPRLSPAQRKAAKARLALIANATGAMQLVQALPASERNDPGLVLDAARYLRRAHADADAAAWWRSQGFAAEAKGGSHLAAFWIERNILARELLKDGDNEGAYQMADDRLQTAPEAKADAAFLSGFIALLRLHDPVRATRQFERLADVSKAAITQARAHYWLGRADAASGRDPHAQYKSAAAYPTTFYGQLAARALGEDPTARILAARDPAFTRTQVWDFTAHELARAAVILVAWGEPGRARSFLLRVAQVTPDPAEQAIAARLALALGMPDTAVFIGRRMGLEGRMLPVDGWPMPVELPDASVDPAVMLALIRQESSFDHGVVSPAGARGLMQLMPATADAVSRQIGGPPATPVSLLTDPAQNMKLGGTYFHGLLDRFGGSLPLAIAAYNAGPNKVDEWLATYGDPRHGAIDMIDWIELIPYGETRNYVQRVLEAVVIYRARRGESGPAVLAQWMR